MRCIAATSVHRLGLSNLTTPPNGNIAPPGYYMLFLLDSAGVPSVAQFIQLSPYAAAPPKGMISAPAADTTIVAGGSVSFGTASSSAKYSWVFPGGSPATSIAKNPGNVTFSTPENMLLRSPNRCGWQLRPDSTDTNHHSSAGEPRF